MKITYATITAAYAALTLTTATLLDLHQQRCTPKKFSWDGGTCEVGADTSLLSQVYNSASSPNPDAFFVLDTTEDGVLEVMPHLFFAEPEPFLRSSDEDDLEVMPRWAMSYTPYTSAGQCKAPAEIRRDAVEIADRGFSVMRLFSTDCDILRVLGATAGKHALKMIPTVYIPEDGIRGSVYEQLDDVLKFAEWDLLEMVVIGNEALFYSYTTAEELAELIATATSKLRAAGYNGPVTTIDHPSMIKLHADVLCPHLHVLASSLQPFFDGGVKARDAGRYLAENLQYLSGVCGGTRDAYVLEVGWPSKGRSNGVAVPGRREQRLALQEMLRAAGSRIALATFEDELWREPGEFVAEQFWGCGHLFNMTSMTED